MSEWGPEGRVPQLMSEAGRVACHSSLCNALALSAAFLTVLREQVVAVRKEGQGGGAESRMNRGVEHSGEEGDS